MYAYIGCRTTKERNARGKGLVVYDIDKDGKWKEIQCLKTEENPSYLCFDNNREFLYSVHGDFTKVSSYRILPDGTVQLLNIIDIDARNPVDITIDRNNRYIIVATLQGGTLVTIEKNQDGSLGRIVSRYTYEGKDKDKVSTVHQCYWDKTKQYMFSCAQGRINGYGQIRALRYEEKSGTFTETDRFMARTWDEPRHVAMHPNNRWLYMVEEKGDKVIYFGFDYKTGKLTPRQELSTLPDTVTEYSDASEVMVDPSGKFIVVSNRYTDIMAIYTIEPETGYLHTHGFTSCLGKTPRFFCFGPDGKCYVANEDSDNIIEFDWNSDYGTLIPTGKMINTGSPVCILFSE